MVTSLLFRLNHLFNHCDDVLVTVSSFEAYLYPFPPLTHTFRPALSIIKYSIKKHQGILYLDALMIFQNGLLSNSSLISRIELPTFSNSS